MSRAKDTDDENNDKPKADKPPGPTDQGRDAGMATREVAPEMAATEDAQEPPD
ncbi:hypothetical protein [Nocardia bhagyanarayanae]|uniref:Uncharacterized protein n=1 Tax=Nocardia bhagyanarayanae TaxID=1215925 RepID=A0A543EXN7_9NOCA|nr:hypothetical protein [Nocardia bhagyanarayanae]TQM26335.1 hypothetical protein FB390_6524 [Nocardia bhagyanarayanae]